MIFPTLQKYEACTAETCLWMLTGQGVITVRKNKHRHSDKSLM